MWYLPIIWAVLLVLFGVLEALTTELTALWFMPASLISLILSFTPVPWWVQVIVFFAISILGIFLFRPIAKKYLFVKSQDTNVDALIGAKCVVTSKIENLAGNGEVKINGLFWAARAAEEDRIFEVGDVVTVVAIEGVKLICK